MVKIQLCFKAAFHNAILFVGALSLGSQALQASELRCGQFQDEVSPYANVSFDAKNMNVVFQGFVGDATWFAIDAVKTNKLSLDYLNQHYAFVKVSFSTPLVTAERKIETAFDEGRPEIFGAQASKLNGNYGAMPVLADVTFSLANTSVAHYKMQLEFSGIENFRRNVTTMTPNNQSSTSDDFIKLRLRNGDIIVHSPCNVRP